MFASSQAAGFSLCGPVMALASAASQIERRYWRLPVAETAARVRYSLARAARLDSNSSLVTGWSKSIQEV